jgi:hypothetical protein
MWALIESNYRPLSYQESVLATELNAQFTYFTIEIRISKPYCVRLLL